MPTDYNDRLKDYVDVKERVRLFYERHPDGRLVTAEAYMSGDPDGNVRAWAKALAYRTFDDPHPGVGHSYVQVPGSTPYTRGSEIENAETSAWGRAIGALGIGIDKSIATTDEIDSKQEGKPTVEVLTAPTKTDDGGLIGKATVGTSNDTDFELRQEPDGWRLGFKLVTNGKGGGIKVMSHGAVAQGLALNKAETIGQRVICWGRIRDAEYQPKGSTKKIVYQVLDLERIQTPDFTLPAVTVMHANDDVIPPPIAPGQETLPLTDDEKAAIAGALE